MADQAGNGRQLSLRQRRGAVLIGTLGLLCAGLLTTAGSSGLGPWWVSTAEANAATPNSRTHPAIRLADELGAPAAADPSTALHGSPEARLIAAYKLVARNRMEDALAATNALLQQYPTFRL